MTVARAAESLEGGAFLCMSGNAWLVVAGIYLEVVNAGDHLLVDGGQTYGEPGVPTATELMADCRILVSLLEAAERAGVGPGLELDLAQLRSGVVALCVTRGFDPGEWRTRVQRDYLLPELPPIVVQALQRADAERARRST